AGENDGDMLPCDLRNVPSRNRRRVRKRFIKMFDQAIENCQAVGSDDELVMIGGEMIGDSSRMLEFVELRFVESDRERLHWPAGRLRPQSDDDAGVDAAREERA